MKVSFFGAARTVTGSLHLLEVKGKRILLECGLFQGRREEAEAINRSFPFDVREIDVVILSHAHIDHSGNLPNLVKQGYEGKIIATPATYDLLTYMLRDSAHIQERDVEYVNKKRKKRGLPPKEPLYMMEDAERALGGFVSLGYREPLEIFPGVELEFMDAGHILGSAQVSIRVKKNGVQKRLLFSGDLGREGLPIIRDPDGPGRTDYLIMESTYGGREHRNIEFAENDLRDIIQKTYGRGGKVIVPSFAVGRTQEVVYSLHRLFDRGELPEMPIFVDSPLAVNVTEVFKRHPECFDEEIKQMIERDGSAFGFGRLTYIRDVEESKALNVYDKPCVIIAASGMCEHGRILHHLKNNIENPKNTVLIVGYQAVHTLGRRLVEKAEVVRIFGEEHRRRAEVYVLDEFSAHADRRDLLRYAKEASPEVCFCVHGENSEIEALRKGLLEEGLTDVRIPARGDAFTL